jgi:hypothetical protein
LVNCGLFSFLDIKRVKIYNESTAADGMYYVIEYTNLHILKNNKGKAWRILLPKNLTG